MLWGTRGCCRVGGRGSKLDLVVFYLGPAQEEGGKQVRCHREVAEELKGQQEAKLVVSLELWQRGEV